jgi:hypothetical protein
MNGDIILYQCLFPHNYEGCYCAVPRKKGEKLCLYDKCRLDEKGKIKPIETFYKGYRFRSRLEARWAVFFDALGIKWEYEIEGYDLGGDIGYYLPDFWIPEFKSFLEIKPEYLDKYDETCNKFISKIGKSIFLVCGSPWKYDGRWYGWDSNDSGGGIGWFEIVITSQKLVIINDICSSRTFMINSDWDSAPEYFNNISDLKQLQDLNYFATDDFIWEDWKNFAYKDCKYAIDKAKQARFEFGENGS